jgi:hypothetical protein
MRPIEQKFIRALIETHKQREADGKVRWLYMVNWIVSVLSSENPDFDAGEFYRAVGHVEQSQNRGPK